MQRASCSGGFSSIRPAPPASRCGRRLGTAAAVLAAGTAIADTLIFSLAPLYPAYADQPHRVFGLSPLHDQQLAGLVMTVEQMVALGVLCACSSSRCFDGSEQRPASPRT